MSMRLPGDSPQKGPTDPASQFGVAALGLGAELALAGWATGRQNWALLGGLLAAAGAVALGLP